MDNETLVIFASPRENGYTAKLLGEYLRDSGISDYSVFDCFSRAPLPCDACCACEKQKGCSKHDIDDFYRAFEEARHIIFAFPVYNGSFPAPMKALIDRMQVYYSARFSLGSKCAYGVEKDAVLLFTCGSETDKTKLLLAQIAPVFTVTGITLKDIISKSGTDFDV